MNRYVATFVLCISALLAAHAQKTEPHKTMVTAMYDVPIERGCYCSEGICPVHVSDKQWAFMDEHSLQFLFGKAYAADQCPVFKEGLAAFNPNNITFGVSYYVNKSGAIVSKFHLQLGDFHGEYALGTDGGSCYLINKAGAASKLNTPGGCETFRANSLGGSESGDLEAYQPGLFDVKEILWPIASSDNSNILRYLDNKGKFVITTNGQSGLPMTDGLAWVRRCSVGCKWGAIDVTGRTVIPFMYTITPGVFSDGMAAVYSSEEYHGIAGNLHLAGFIDKSNNLVIQPKYVHILSPFTDGAAIVVMPQQYNTVNVVIDRQGKVLKELGSVDCNRSDAFCTYEGNGGKGLIDRKGNVVIPAGKFFKIGEFGEGKDGLAMAIRSTSDGDTEGYINIRGEFVLIKGKSQF